MSKMRAKLIVNSVEESFLDDRKVGERLIFSAVANCPYPEDGSDEDNTYAKFSPDAKLSIFIANPALFCQFKVNEKYYVDFSKA